MQIVTETISLTIAFFLLDFIESRPVGPVRRNYKYNTFAITCQGNGREVQNLGRVGEGNAIAKVELLYRRPTLLHIVYSSGTVGSHVVNSWDDVSSFLHEFGQIQQAHRLLAQPPPAQLLLAQQPHAQQPHAQQLHAQPPENELQRWQPRPPHVPLDRMK